MADEEKKDLFGKLGNMVHSIIYEQTPEYLKQANGENTPIQTPVNNNVSMTETILPANTNEIDNHFAEQIRKAIREADQPGPDFLELSDAVKKLQSLNPSMDVSTAIQNAFIVLSSGGLTKSRVLETGSIYLNVLKTQTQKFEESMLKGSQSKIDTPQQEIEQIKESNRELEKQKRELDIQIETNNRLITSKQSEIDIAKEKLSVNKAKFFNTVKNIESEFTDLISKVQNMNL